MIVSAYTLLAVVWAEAFLQVIRSRVAVVVVAGAAAAAHYAIFLSIAFRTTC